MKENFIIKINNHEILKVLAKGECIQIMACPKGKEITVERFEKDCIHLTMEDKVVG